jgi:hypothetical protein
MLVYLTAIWYILWSLDTFFPVLVYCTKKNLATLAQGCQNGRLIIIRFGAKFFSFSLFHSESLIA